MTGEPKQVLVVDDEANMRKVLSALLRRDGYEVQTSSDGQEALSILAEHHIDIVITDLKMPRLDGMGVLRHVIGRYGDLPVIVITAHGTVDTAVEALKLGAFDYITKPFDKEEMRRVVAKAARASEGSRKEPPPEAGAKGRFRIVGLSQPMKLIYQLLERVAATPSTVLITGESGTGKELVARALYENSHLASAPYIRVNCAAMPRELIESELFGYEKGAFTGAVTNKPGKFELADGGTLFLDEVGEISPEIQVKLLRVLQEGEFDRVGGVKTQKVNVRLITATNRDLKDLLASGSFREDLYYRLNVVHIHVPPLRERPEDIPILVEHFLEKFNERLGRKIATVAPEALTVMKAYRWPGNVRELENVMERCTLFCDNTEIAASDLPAELGQESAPSAAKVSPQPEVLSLKDQVQAAASRLERELILKALEQTGGNVSRAARLLQISRKSLQNKMKELGLREAKAG